MTLKSGEVVLIRMRFHQEYGGKVRPAMTLFDTGDDDFIAAPITSRPRQSQFDIPLMDWQATGLNVPFTTRIHKLTVLAKSDVMRVLGFCSASDHQALRISLCELFCPQADGAPHKHGESAH